MALTNHKFLLAARPVGMPKRSDWTYVEEPVAEPKDGELLVKLSYVSLDPAMRIWINDVRSYMLPVGIGEVMRALGVGTVAASRNPRFAEGDHVSGVFGMQEYALTDGKGVTKVERENLSAAEVSQRSRHAGHDCVFRASRHRPAEIW